MGGITRNHIKKSLSRLRSVKAWQMILVLIPLLFIAATFLRLDHITMTNLKSDVLAADEANDDQAIADGLQKLRDFTFSHTVVNITEINGSEQIILGTGPFYLENQYLRAANAAVEQAEAANQSNPNGNIYAAASAVCKPQAIAGGWAWNSAPYLNCMTSEIAKYPAGSDYTEATIPSTELFRYNFASPIWAPTLSGFAILLCAILIIAIFIRFIIWCILNLALIFLKHK